MRAACLVVVLAGCDGVFGLTHIRDRSDANTEPPDAAPCPSQLFSSGVDFATGQQPYDIALVDFDQDTANTLDIIVTNEIGSSVSVLLGAGDGTFAPHIETRAGSSPRGLAVGDVDQDGKLDIVASSAALNTVSILLGTENGGVGNPVAVQVGTPTADVALATMNSDEAPDLLTALPGAVGVQLNNGTGLFSDVMAYTVGMTPNDIGVGDLDLDGLVDAVTANAGGSTISVLIHVGEGFGPHNPFDAGASPHAIAVGLFDGDALPDIAVVAVGSSTVEVLRNAGAGTFGSVTSIPVPASPFGLAAADVDGDRDIDLVVSSRDMARLTILENDGMGTFTPLARTLDAAESPFRLALADVDRDGRADIVVVQQVADTVRVYRACTP